ncbi:hypothetical protein, partial [Xylella fastidiosa]|uniref:hypothetical protein n=1 Tax=Xylella fastidiosa TaxID=2371 RepID=UPI001EEAB2FC
MYSQGDSIYLMDTTGQVRVRYDKELLSKVWSENQKKLEVKTREKALPDVNNPAPIVAATNIRAPADKQVRENPHPSHEVV